MTAQYSRQRRRQRGMIGVMDRHPAGRMVVPALLDRPCGDESAHRQRLTHTLTNDNASRLGDQS